MLIMKFMAFFCVFLSSTVTHAFLVNDANGKIEISLPPHWKYEKNLLGLPHVFLSPGDRERISVSLTLTGIADVKLSPKELKLNQKDYQQGRTLWALSRNYAITKFYPYENLNTLEGRQIHAIGFEYKDIELIQEEMSYYIECPETLVHLKVLGSSLKETSAFIKTLKCK